jgi:membrane protein required for colicin V production
MTAFDFTVIVILLASLLLGIWRGLVYEILSFLGWPVAYVLSKFFANSVATMMPIPQEAMRLAVAYVVLFIGGLIAWSMVVFVLAKLVKAVGLVGLDSMLGSVFGLLRGAMVVIALVCLAGLTKIPEQPFWRNARMSKAAEDFAVRAKTLLPVNVAQRIQFPSRS